MHLFIFREIAYFILSDTFYFRHALYKITKHSYPEMICIGLVSLGRRSI